LQSSHGNGFNSSVLDGIMSVQTYNELADHYGHSLNVAIYGDQTNIAIECENCNEVLLDFDNEEE
jgi:hypothetical protein